MVSKASRALALAFVLSLIAIPAVAHADFPQFRISNFGPDADLTQQASLPAAAYNTQTNQFFVVYEAGPQADDNHWTIFGQFLDAAGNRIGDPQQISLPTADDICLYDPPNVAYGEKLNEFLVTWNQGKAGDCDDNVRVQRVAADGTLLGDPSKQISASGMQDIETTNPVYNPFSNEWLVEWKSRVPGKTDQELFAQRLAADGAETGTDDQQLTDFAGAGGNADDATAVAVNPTDGRYLSVVHGSDTGLSSRTEVYGHLMESDGTVVGPDHFRISHVADTNPAGDVSPPSVAYNPGANNFVVAWFADAKTGSLVDNENEVFARFVDKDGGIVGTFDIRYSDMGPDGSTNFRAFRPDIRFNPNANELFFAWQGDDDTPPLVDNESEAFGQRVAADGSEIGDNDFRISHDGPDGDVKFAANRTALAYNSSSCQNLVVWGSGHVGIQFGDDSEEWDIYGNLVDTPCPPVNRTLPQISGTAQEGQTVACSDGTWSGRGLTFSREWLRDGTAIGGATGASYALAAADVGHQIACRVKASDPDGTASATSAAVAPTAKPVVIPISTPATPDKTAPVCTLSVRKQKLANVLKKGLKATASCNEAAALKALLRATFATPKKGARAARVLTVSTKNVKLTEAGKVTFTLKLTKKAKKTLAKVKKLKLTVQVTARDAAGNTGKVVRKSLTLKR